jgi:hypothetical protein
VEVVPHRLWHTPRDSFGGYEWKYAGLMVWWVRNKLKDDDGNREINYEMKGKMETTESNIKG